MGSRISWDSCKELNTKRPEGIQVFDGYIHDEDDIDFSKMASFGSVFILLSLERGSQRLRFLAGGQS